MYSGALALNTAATSGVRGVLRTAASGLDVRTTSADSALHAALSRYPSRRTDQFFPKPRGEGVRPIATLTATRNLGLLNLGYRKVTSQAALSHSHARLVVAAAQRPHGRQRLRCQPSSNRAFLLGAGADKPRRLSLTHLTCACTCACTHASRVRHGPCAPCTMRQTGCRPMSEGRGMLLRWSRTTVPCK